MRKGTASVCRFLVVVALCAYFAAPDYVDADRSALLATLVVTKSQIT